MRSGADTMLMHRGSGAPVHGAGGGVAVSSLFDVCATLPLSMRSGSHDKVKELTTNNHNLILKT